MGKFGSWLQGQVSRATLLLVKIIVLIFLFCELLFSTGFYHLLEAEHLCSEMNN